MNYTNYFNGINIGNIDSICENCINGLKRMKSNNITGLSEFESPSINKMESALKRLDVKMDAVIEYLRGYRVVLSIAEKVQKIQEKMKNTSDYDTNISYTKSIQEYIKKIAYYTSDLSSAVSGSTIASLSTTTSFIETFSGNLNPLLVNYEKLKALKDKFADYGSQMYNNYKEFWSLKSSVSKDSYLQYGWLKVVRRYQSMLKKRDSIAEYWLNYLSNLKRLELQLPENTTLSLKHVEAKKYSGSSAYNSLSITKPSLSAYTAAGVTSAITKPETSTTSGTTSSETGSGSGSSSTGSGSGTQNRSTSGSSSNSSKVKTRSNQKSTQQSMNYQATTEYNKALQAAKERAERAQAKLDSYKTHTSTGDTTSIYEQNGRIYHKEPTSVGYVADVTNSPIGKAYKNVQQTQKSYNSIASQSYRYNRSTSGK